MFVKRFVASQSALWIATAILLLAIPRSFLGFFGAVLDGGGIALARLFSAELTALAIVSYCETSLHKPSVSRMAWLAYVISNTLGFTVCLTAVLSGAFNARAWMLVALYLLYAVVFLMILLRNPGETS